MKTASLDYVRNGKYDVRNVFGGADTWAAFQDSSGKSASGDLVVQATIWCPITSLQSFAYELEARSCVGLKAFRFSEMRREGQKKTAKEWLRWYLTEGCNCAPFGLHVFDAANLTSVAGNPIYYYNQQAKVGMLHQLRHFFPTYDPISLQIFLDSEYGFTSEPTSRWVSSDNLPIYLRNGIAYHTCVKSRLITKYPPVFVPNDSRSIHRTIRPVDLEGRYAWRILQLADLLAGAAAQSKRNSSSDPTKTLLGQVLAKHVNDSKLTGATHCYVESVDLSKSLWDPAQLDAFGAVAGAPIESLTMAAPTAQLIKFNWQQGVAEEPAITVRSDRTTSTTANTTQGLSSDK